jgi:hypothetical protein
MKQKHSVFIEREVLRVAKQKATQEGRALDDLIEDALDRYLNSGANTAGQRKMAFHLFCEQPMKISPKQLHYLLDEDMWNV